MKSSQYLSIVGIMYIAPHVNQTVGVLIGMVFLILSVIAIRGDL